MAGHAFDQHDRSDRARPRGGRSRSDRARSRSSSQSSSDASSPACGSRTGRACALVRSSAVRGCAAARRRARARPLSPARACGNPPADLAVRHSGPGDDRIGTFGLLRDRVDRGGREAAVIVLRQPDDHRFGHARCRAACSHAFDGRDRTACRRRARIAAVAPSSAAPGTSAAAGDDQDAALGLLVAVDDRRQRVGRRVRLRSSGVPCFTASPSWRRARRSSAHPLPRAARRGSTATARERTALRIGLEVICAMPQLSTSACLSIARIACLVELLEDVAEAQHDDLVADDQHAPVAIMEVDRVEHRPQPQDDVGPALAAGRAVVEFAEPACGARPLPGICRGCRAWSAGRRCRTRARAGARRRSVRAGAAGERALLADRSPRSAGREHRARRG